MLLSFYIGMVVGVVVGLILAGLLHMASDSERLSPQGNGHVDWVRVDAGSSVRHEAWGAVDRAG